MSEEYPNVVIGPPVGGETEFEEIDPCESIRQVEAQKELKRKQVALTRTYTERHRQAYDLYKKLAEKISQEYHKELGQLNENS